MLELFADRAQSDAAAAMLKTAGKHTSPEPGALSPEPGALSPEPRARSPHAVHSECALRSRLRSL